MTRDRVFAPSVRRGWLGLAGAALVLVSACTFEQAGAARGDEVEAPEVPPVLGNGSGLPMGEDLALETVRLFRESVASGDLSLALSLLDREASLVEAVAGENSERVTRGELLLELRRRHAAGLQFELLDSRIALHADGVALVLSRLAALQEGADGYGEEVGRVDETVVLVATSDGWRIRHLHRSLRPDG